ncbi:hypothetical protein, partial [Vibrio diabolicus]|uniref:hypothetical protein n=1 Tax=Vibrio diabolicus TaxID=50719 RepID=UPI00211ACBBF|nr:hypothetical protein [Vibrio diabolicus]
ASPSKNVKVRANTVFNAASNGVYEQLCETNHNNSPDLISNKKFLSQTSSEQDLTNKRTGTNPQITIHKALANTNSLRIKVDFM